MNIKKIMEKVYEGKNIVCIEMPDNAKLQIVSSPYINKGTLFLYASPEEYLETNLWFIDNVKEPSNGGSK